MKPFKELRDRTRPVVLPPGPQDTFETLDRGEAERARQAKAERGEQFNVRTSAEFIKRMELLKERMRARNWAEVLDAMLTAFEAAGAALDADEAPAAERKAGRKHELKIWASEFVYKASPKVAAARELSLSELYEELLAHEVHKLDPHGSGRFGAYVKR